MWLAMATGVREEVRITITWEEEVIVFMFLLQSV
jgi:hypothetical protein